MARGVLGDRGVDGPVADGLQDGLPRVDADEADLFMPGILVPFGQDRGRGDGRVVAGGDHPVDLVHAGRQGALDLDRGLADLGHVRDGLDDLDAGMGGRDLADAVVAVLGVDVRDEFQDVQDPPLAAHERDQLLGRRHGRGLDVGAHGEGHGRGQGRARRRRPRPAGRGRSAARTGRWPRPDRRDRC